jgi:putative transposase
LRRLIAARPLATRLPATRLRPQLNPVENVWSNARRSLANLAAGTVADLVRTVRNRLKRMQYRPGLMDGSEDGNLFGAGYSGIL